MAGVDRGEGGVAVGDFLDGDDLSRRVEAEAAVTLVNRDPHQAELAQAADEAGGIRAGAVAVCGARDDLVPREAPKRVA